MEKEIKKIKNKSCFDGAVKAHCGRAELNIPVKNSTKLNGECQNCSGMDQNFCVYFQYPVIRYLVEEYLKKFNIWRIFDNLCDGLIACGINM